MPYPQTLIKNCFQDFGLLNFFEFFIKEFAIPTFKTILPPIM